MKRVEFPKGYTFRGLPPGLKIMDTYIGEEISSNIENGLWAISPFRKGQIFGVTHIPDPRFENGLIRTGLGSFVNCNVETPNTALVKDDTGLIYLVAIKDIPAYTELTCNYFEAACAEECGFK